MSSTSTATSPPLTFPERHALLHLDESVELMASAVVLYDAKRDYMAKLKIEMAHSSWVKACDLVAPLEAENAQVMQRISDVSDEYGRTAGMIRYKIRCECNH